MYKSYHYFNIFSASIFCLYAIGKGPLYGLIAYALIFSIHPLADFILNRYFKKSLLQDNQTLKSTLSYQAPLLLALPFQITLLLWAFKYGSSSLTEAVVSGAICGLSGGILGIGMAHEMIHRKSTWERAYGKSMLYILNYPHFVLEHLYHHIKVGTPQDPDTAQSGESLYHFLLRSSLQGWLTCWKWENQNSKQYQKIKLHKASEQKKHRFQFTKGPMAELSLYQLLLNIIIFALFGTAPLIIFIVQGLFTLALLKWISYIGHYGLEQNLPENKMKSYQLYQSWDSTSPLTNFFLFNLGYHSQHHRNPQTNYYELPRAKKDWNELPAGYSAMMVLALIPPLWKPLMKREIEKITVRPLKITEAITTEEPFLTNPATHNTANVNSGD